MRARIVSWNVHSFVGTDGAYDPGRVARVLAELDADVIGLQEVDWRRPRVDGLPALDRVAKELGMEAVAGPCLRDEVGDYGNALLSRHGVLEHRAVPLVHGRAEPRGVLDARVRVPSGSIRVLVTHLGLSRPARRKQARLLRAAIDAARGQPLLPTVLVGDLNEWLPLPLALPRLFPGAFPVSLGGRTFPSRFPIAPLDRALVRPEPRELSFHVASSREARVASDHLPIVVDVAWG